MIRESASTTLGHVLAAIVDHRGRTPKKLGTEFWRTGIPVISAKNVKAGRLDLSSDVRFVSRETYDRWMRVKLRAGDVLLTSEAPLGEAAYLQDATEYCLGQRLFALRADPKKIDARFLYYALRSPAMQDRLHARATGTTAQGIRQSELLKVRIDCPPLPEQRAIGQTLGALDDKIELNRRTTGTLHELARALFRGWFVDFEPVLATTKGAQRQWIDDETLGLFPHKPVDSPLGPIPAGWSVQRIGDHVEAVRGLSYSGAGLAASGMPLHNLDSVYEGGGYKYEGIKYYAGEYRERHIAKAGDVIVANTEQGFDELLIGCPAIVPRRYGPEGLFSHHLYRVRPRPDSALTPRFLYLLLLPGWFRSEVVGYANGTTVNMLPQDALQRPRLVVPPRPIVERFEQIVSPLFDKIEQLADESAVLAELRDTLLPKLISGEIRVRDAEALAEARAR